MTIFNIFNERYLVSIITVPVASTMNDLLVLVLILRALIRILFLRQSTLVTILPFQGTGTHCLDGCHGGYGSPIREQQSPEVGLVMRTLYINPLLETIRVD